MRIDRLEQAQHDPRIHGQDVQIMSDRAPEDWTDNGAEPEQEDFNWTCVFCGKPKGSGVLMVNLVDHFVQSRCVQGAVGPVVPGVFHDEEDGDLVGHCEDGGEGDGGREAEKLGKWVEEPDLRELDSEMGKQDELGAVPLFGCGGDFLLRTKSAPRTDAGR